MYISNKIYPFLCQPVNTKKCTKDNNTANADIMRPVMLLVVYLNRGLSIIQGVIKMNTMKDVIRIILPATGNIVVRLNDIK
jgi:hypothetical protein